MKHSATAVMLTIAAAISSTAAELAFKLQWYADGGCSVFRGEYDYNDGGIFGSGNTSEECKNIGLGLNIGSANVIGGDVGADCALWTGPNCTGQQLAYIDEGTTGHFGNSACYYLAAPIQSFECHRKGSPVKA